MIVRICFVLGNLTAKNEIARQRLFSELHAVDSLLLVMKTYDKLDIEVIFSTPAFLLICMSYDVIACLVFVWIFHVMSIAFFCFFLLQVLIFNVSYCGT